MQSLSAYQARVNRYRLIDKTGQVDTKFEVD